MWTILKIGISLLVKSLLLLFLFFLFYASYLELCLMCYSCPTYQLPSSCYTVTAAGQCCPQAVCRMANGTTFNPITSPNPLYPVYGSYKPGMTGFRPGYSPSSGNTQITGTSRKLPVCHIKDTTFHIRVYKKLCVVQCFRYIKGSMMWLQL